MSIYEWVFPIFSPKGRQAFVQTMAPHLSKVIAAGDDVLDLCCGAGAFSFWMEEQGANVTGVDYMPLMIEQAQETAAARNSAATFIQADVLSHAFGHEAYDRIILLGNALMDFSLNSLVALRGRMAEALRPDGLLAVHHVDGMLMMLEHQTAGRRPVSANASHITRQFKRYMPEASAFVETFHNEQTGETLDYMSYLYTPPLVRLALDPTFELKESVQVDDQNHLDIFVKRE